MRELGPILLVLAAQVTLPVVGGLLLSRRRDPAAACGPLLVAAIAALLLTPLALAPRPSWPAHDRSPAPVDAPVSAPAAESVVSSGGLSGGIDVMQLLHVPRPDTTEQPTTFSAWRLVSICFLVLAALGLARLLVGLLATSRVVRRGRAVDDAGLLSLAAELRRAMGCRRTFTIRESDKVGTAATAGWPRPVILLSPAWRSWTSAEHRAVLAHEIAHVARGDFASRIIARLAVAIHGYHPLLRWLAARLELRQEMAADIWAASQCGGRPAYLKSLAALALRADARPLAAAPTFMSRPRSLLRRIAMLSVTEDTRARRRWPAIAAVIALAAASLALNGSTPDALAGPVVRAKAEAPAERLPLDASFVLPSDKPDEVGVYAVRVGALFRTPGMEKMADMYSAMVKTMMGEGKAAQFELTDVEQVSGRVTLTHDPKKPAPNRSLMMSLTSIRMEKDFDWVKQLKAWGEDWKEHAHAGTTYYSGKMSVPMLGFKDTTVWFYLPDARTMVLESEENIKKLIDAKGKPVAAAWTDEWKLIQGGLLAVVLPDVKGKIAPKIPAEKTNDPVKAAAVGAIAAIVKKTSRVAISFDMGEGMQLGFQFTCNTHDDALAVSEPCNDIVNACRKVMEADMGGPETDLEKLGRKLSMEMLQSITISTREGSKQTGVLIKTKGGMTEFLKAFSATTEGK